MTDVDWELKDRRIAWMSITKSLAEVQAALINSGNVKFKSLEDALEDLKKSRVVELNAFLEIDSIWTPPAKTDDDKRYVCEKCNAKITEGVSNWSLKEYNRALCMKCQGKEKQ